ncbi:MAG: DNA-binding protein WhiA [Syntrophomonadaceae bacterium]|nr:DNA-binding protein WhiA [Syntrophomonadaceae bacterium]MDD3889289.1 DNA-binding protein WhiA [Syntrophomonadaceae bacterium]MDD4549780.1 DNA-binding protein WhiA [Syntrophomonadaceae bacterium]
MSFSNDVRNELARVMPEKECCAKAELSALLAVSGIFLHKGSRESIFTTTIENAATARKIFKLIKQTYHLQSSVRMGTRRRFQKSRVYEVNTFLEQAGLQALQELNIIDSNLKIKHEIPRSLTSKTCCKRAYIRGIFLNRGFVNRPEGTYHLEIIFNQGKLAGEVQKMLETFNLQARIIERKNNLVLYLKESEQIVDFLRVVGANNALLDFENVRILKSMRNHVNRQVNCETANLSKTIDASIRQIELIKNLIKDNGWDNLSPELKELATLRINYPDSTLKELGTMLNPPLSKSGVAYRMRKLEKMAEELGNN